MPSAVPKRDCSLDWPTCPQCSYRHDPGAADHPRPGVWLVAGTRTRDAYPLVVLGTRVLR